MDEEIGTTWAFAVSREHFAMNRRTPFAGIAALFALSGSVPVVWLTIFDLSRPEDIDLVWYAIGYSACCLSCGGVWAWRHDRLGLATLGAWAAILPNLWLWSAVLVPIGFALVTTVMALARVCATRGRDRCDSSKA